MLSPGVGACVPRCGKPLVHGDYFPENVMVADDGRICGVIDFGALTLIGDADVDLACAVLNLTGMAGVTPEDRRIALKRAEALGLTSDWARTVAFMVRANHPRGVRFMVIAKNYDDTGTSVSDLSRSEPSIASARQLWKVLRTKCGFGWWSIAVPKPRPSR
jgi:Ser/Thr protein kinase RdoA (MazF antagonist)